MIKIIALIVLIIAVFSQNANLSSCNRGMCKHCDWRRGEVLSPWTALMAGCRCIKVCSNATEQAEYNYQDATFVYNQLYDSATKVWNDYYKLKLDCALDNSDDSTDTGSNSDDSGTSTLETEAKKLQCYYLMKRCRWLKPQPSDAPFIHVGKCDSSYRCQDKKLEFEKNTEIVKTSTNNLLTMANKVWTDYQDLKQQCADDS